MRAKPGAWLDFKKESGRIIKCFGWLKERFSVGEVCLNRTLEEVGSSLILGRIPEDIWEAITPHWTFGLGWGPGRDSGAHCWHAGWLLAAWVATGAQGVESTWSDEANPMVWGVMVTTRTGGQDTKLPIYLGAKIAR